MPRVEETFLPTALLNWGPAAPAVDPSLGAHCGWNMTWEPARLGELGSFVVPSLGLMTGAALALRVAAPCPRDPQRGLAAVRPPPVSCP